TLVNQYRRGEYSSTDLDFVKEYKELFERIYGTAYQHAKLKTMFTDVHQIPQALVNRLNADLSLVLSRNFGTIIGKTSKLEIKVMLLAQALNKIGIRQFSETIDEVGKVCKSDGICTVGEAQRIILEGNLLLDLLITALENREALR
ncbi:MAG TPA: hypothetical protein VNJ29_00355, partial [Candidatus Nitrosotenuis sp.]|nr:hypothetical protein [Candidatus Nitrosotenuis sp.]